jgi:ribosomal peptide maturation radical SAM protein 1
MPWATSARPSLSLGILSAVLRGKGYDCDVLYPNIFLSALMGYKGYEYITNTPVLFGLAEHLFAVTVFGLDDLRSEQYLSSFASGVRPDGNSPDAWNSALFTLRDRIIPDLLDAFTEELLCRRPDVVGFTCTFNQVMPSVALAKRLKSADPAVQVLLGGPCVHGEMGVCYSRIFRDYVDAVFIGEADHLLPEYLSTLARGETVQGLAGVAAGGESKGEAPLFDKLDELPTPDFSDYFAFREQLAEEGFKLAPFHSLPFEASRGCWWGEKHHCTFCGLNNLGMGYRRKSVAKVVGELSSLSETHGVTNFMAADNILDYRAYVDLLPALAAIPADFRFFFELKANVRREDVEKLAAAGVTWVQPGFESFSDRVLRLMRKGATAFQNVQTLKWLCEFGIEVSYNLLVGFPGETDEDYLEMVGLMEKIQHLPSPGLEANVVQVQRFAPFHFDHEGQGIGEIRGAGFYDYLIPRAVASSDEFAYFFERDIPSDSPLQRHLDSVNEMLARWSHCEQRLSLRLGAGRVELITQTAGVESSRLLPRLASAVLILSDETISERQLAHHIGPSGLAAAGELEEVVARLEKDGLLMRAGNQLLCLVPFSKPQSAERLKRWLQRWCKVGGDRRDAPERVLPVLPSITNGG